VITVERGQTIKPNEANEHASGDEAWIADVRAALLRVLATPDAAAQPGLPDRELVAKVLAEVAAETATPDEAWLARLQVSPEQADQIRQRLAAARRAAARVDDEQAVAAALAPLSAKEWAALCAGWSATPERPRGEPHQG
jgi:hypothetical protein